MKNRTLHFAAYALIAVATAVSAQEPRVYKEGPLVEISSIKVKPGQFDNYMKYLAGPYRDLMEANKKAGLVVSFAVYANRARNPQDADLFLVTTYANWAALDRVEDGIAVAQKVMGSASTQAKAFADRGTMREVLGSNIVQELVLK